MQHCSSWSKHHKHTGSPSVQNTQQNCSACSKHHRKERDLRLWSWTLSFTIILYLWSWRRIQESSLKSSTSIQSCTFGLECSALIQSCIFGLDHDFRNLVKKVELQYNPILHHVNAAGSVSETFAVLIHASLANVTSTGEQELQELVSYIPKFEDELPEIQGICSDKMGNWRRASSCQEQFWVYIVLFSFGVHSLIQKWSTTQVRPNFPT